MTEGLATTTAGGAASPSGSTAQGRLPAAGGPLALADAALYHASQKGAGTEQTCEGCAGVLGHQRLPRGTTDFSIARLLGEGEPRAARTAVATAATTTKSSAAVAEVLRGDRAWSHATAPVPGPAAQPCHYEWLRCSRYQPPRVPRTRRQAEAGQRRPGRLPRIPFTPEQLKMMEAAFARDQYLRATRAAELASAMQLPPLKVKVWFQNRRARQKRDERFNRSSVSS